MVDEGTGARTPPTGRGPRAIRLGSGAGWSLTDFVCDGGPGDRPFEEWHDDVSIAAVVEGTFDYACDTGRALMLPGAFLLGNAGRCYSCGHGHGVGDRCIGLGIDREMFAEIAATRAGSARFAFSSPSLPPSDRLLATTVATEVAAAAVGETATAGEELVVAVVATVVGLASGHTAAAPAPSARDERRIADSLRRIEADAEEALDLAGLAAEVGMSRYHYLRTFRRVTGTTPHRHLLATRLRRAAVELAAGDEAITTIAFDAGFGDLSTFVHRFRRFFGTTPSGWRARHRRGRGAA
jgi:AraC-like DNA-binding protein